MPLVSVIVPVYNAENLIDFCVKSLLSQTFNDFEIILVDDGSTDNSGLLCDQYQNIDSRVRVFHKDNGGVSSARNFGIQKSKGEYIVFVDSDDYVENKYLEFLVNFKMEHKNIENIWCHFKTVKNHDTFVDMELSHKKGFELLNFTKIMDLHERWLDAAPYCKLYEREIIINNEILFTTDLSLGEDLCFNFSYLDHTNGEIAIISNTLYYYFVDNENSLSNKYYSDMFSIYKRLNKMMYEYLIKWGCNINQITKLYNASFFKYEEVLRNTFNKNNLKSKKEKFKYNNSIIKSIEFQEAYKKGNFSLNMLYRLAYATKNYRFILIVEKFFKMIKR